MKRSTAPMTRHVVKVGALKAAPLGLVDVGCSGGLDRRWDLFKGQLRAWGFDPLQGEIDRLAALGEPGVTYHAAWIGYKNYDRLLEAGYARPDQSDLTNDP